MTDWSDCRLAPAGGDGRGGAGVRGRIRRLRPNILIGGVDGMDEVNWPGSELHIGEAVIRVDSRRGRCSMTIVDPDTIERDPQYCVTSRVGLTVISHSMPKCCARVLRLGDT